MKKSTLVLLVTLLFVLGTQAQSPQTIPYQAIARDAHGTPIPNQHMQIKLSVLQSVGGTVDYAETDTFTTSKLGSFTVNLGTGTAVTNTFASINWASGTKFLKVELDPAGGTSYTNMGTSQMLSVPFALQSASSASAVAQPANRVLYSSGTGNSSDGQFTRASDGTTNIGLTHGKYKQALQTGNLEGFGANSLGAYYIDTVSGDQVILFLGDGTLLGNPSGYFAVLGYGNFYTGRESVLNIDTTHIQLSYINGANNSTVEAEPYSASLNILNGTSHRSIFAVDTDGMHWEYKDTDRYVFPLYDGSADQVLSTNGSGSLSWKAAVSGYTDYSSTSTIIGWSSFTKKVLSYHREGPDMVLDVSLVGTSNSTSTSFTIPTALASGAADVVQTIYIQNNGVAAAGMFQLTSTTTPRVDCFSSISSAGWTASGSKSVYAHIVYRVQ